MPEYLKKPSKLEKKKLGDLCFTDEFWELDILFKCTERWALEPKIRKGIDAMYMNMRALEEISILGSEADRYFKWLSSRLSNCERLISIIDLNSSIGSQILKIGLKTADALRRLEGLVVVKLGEDDKFKSVKNNIECNTFYVHALTLAITQKVPELVKEWMRSLENIIGSTKSITFALGDEPEDLIEDIGTRIAIEIEVEAEEEELDRSSEDND